MGSSWIQINLIEDEPEFIIRALLRTLRGNRCQCSILVLAQLERSQLQIVIRLKIRAEPPSPKQQHTDVRRRGGFLSTEHFQKIKLS